MRKKPSRSSPKAAEAALHLLAHRDHSKAEIRRKLGAKGFGTEEIEEALQGLEARGILDDARFAQRMALCLTGEKLFGPQRIRQKLFQKGLPADQIREALEKAEEHWPIGERLRMVVSRRLKGLRLAQIPPGEKKKLAHYLRQRGFLWEDIQESFQKEGGFTEEC